MKILVTGAKGFIGKNLVAELKNQGYKNIYEYTRETDNQHLDKYAKECNFVFHLAGINRPQNEKEFMAGNYDFTLGLLDLLKQNNNKAPVLLTSSVQARLNNPYGVSKKASEDLMFTYSQKTGAKVYVYRLPNVFGKWSRPNYNSVVATFCHNIARNLPIKVSNPEVELTLSYIDDVIKEFIKTMRGNPTVDGQYCVIPTVYNIKLGELATLIKSFKEVRTNLAIPNLGDTLQNKLYSTYLSYLPKDDFSYALQMNVDHRGSFTEFLRTPERGQISVNVSKPGITKGNHWHHSKNEKFLVVSGQGLIRLRDINSQEIIEYRVSGDKLEVVDIPVGYTHSILNVGDTDLVTIMWANECYDPQNPDTYYLEV